MTYKEAIDILFNSLPVWEQKGAGAYKPGLERVLGFSASLGNPHERFRSVHVAGTNGKGSVSHLLAAVLQKAGYRTGLFTSPHLVDFRERIRIDGEMIPEEAVVEFTERYYEDMLRWGLTFFEMATVMAFWWFGRNAGDDFMSGKSVDVAVIETGLGGRLDSTNIITPMVGVITNIGLEHTQYLGDTIAKIAAEKAGIIKAGVPVIIGETGAESEPVFRAKAAEMGTEIIFADAELENTDTVLRNLNPSQPFRLDLAGNYQQKNLATVLATVDVLRRRLEITDEALREGLQNAASLTGLSGRWQVVGNHPLVVLDTAHNAHGFVEIVRQLTRQKFDRLYMVLGFAADKDLATIIPLLPKDARYILTRADTPRAMAVEELARRFVECGFAADNIETVEPVSDAVRRALSLASEDDMVYIGGSNFVVGEYLREI